MIEPCVLNGSGVRLAERADYYHQGYVYLGRTMRLE